MIFVLLVVDIAIYLFMAASTGQTSWRASQLLQWGGNLGELSLHGQPWRLLTAVFVHASPQHIFGNMVLLLVSGSFLERKVGSVRFVLIYLATGLAGSLLSAWAHPDIVSVGASGAIAGLLGTMVTLKLTARAPEVSGGWMVQVIGVNALYSFAPDVDGLAHLGGFVAGLALGAVAARVIPSMVTG